MKLFSTEQKTAFARVITDLIEADFVVEPDEMNFFEDLISKERFGISHSMLTEAKKMDFAKAVAILKEIEPQQREELIHILKQLSLSDGTCVPLEAILIFAIEQALTDNASIHSIPCRDISIENLKVLYVESGESTDASRIIEENFTSINSQLRMVGFDFVYIPKVVDDFKLMESQYLEKVIRYMLPSVSAERVSSACSNLLTMTTSKFCRDLLLKQLDLDLSNTPPSLLIKINDTYIVNKYDNDGTERVKFSNFIQIGLGENPVETIMKFVESYYSTINSPITVINKPKAGKFIYSGFHRTLFDLIAYGYEEKEYRLVFDIKKQKPSVYFESLDESERHLLKLNPQEMALYYMIVAKSINGEGLDWRENIPQEEKEALLEEYNSIYRIIGKSNTVTEYKDRTQVHHIKNRIRTLKHIANAIMFTPEYYRAGNRSYYRIKGDKTQVRIITNTTL